MSQSKRLRWTDLFGVLGILLLMVSIPATIAQDESSPAEVEFTLPPPRAGDFLELEAVVQWKEEPAQVVGPVVTVEHRLPTADEAPIPVDFAVVHRYPALNLTVGEVVVRSHPYEVTYYYNEGAIVYFRLEGSTTDIWGNTATRAKEYAAYGRSSLAYAMGTEVYHTRDVSSALQRLAADALGPGRTAVSSDLTVEHHDKLVYGGTNSAVEQMFGGLEDALDALEGPDECEVLNLFPFPRYGGAGPIPYGMFQMTKQLPLSDCSHDIWSWFHPDHPERVGYHYEVRAADERVVALDVLPRRLLAGEGAPYVLAPNDARDDETIPDAVPLDPVLPLVSLRDMDQDPTPLLRGITFEKLRGVLASDGSPEDVRDALRQGARIVDFAWREDNFTTIPIDGSRFHPLIPALEGPRATARFETFWSLALATDEGELWLVDLMLEDTPQGDLEVRDIWDACPDEGCQHLPDPAVFDLDRQVSVPAALVAAIQDDLEELGVERAHPDAAAPTALAFRSHWYEKEYGEGQVAPIPFVDMHGYGTSYYDPRFNVEADWRSEGSAVWRQGNTPAGGYEDGADGYYDLSTGRMLARHVWEKQEDPVVSEVQPQSTTAPYIFTPGLVAPASAGLALILLSLFVRLVSALKAGAHYPFAVWLYAKIPKHKVLTQERRAALMDIIEAEPGITVSEVIRRSGYGWGATVHHLATLERNGLVTKLHQGRTLHWYAAATIDRKERLLFAAMQQPDQAQILAAAERGAVSAEELAELTGRSRSRVSRLANRLATMGLLEKVRDRRTVRFRLAGSPALPQHEPVESDGVVA